MAVKKFAGLATVPTSNVFLWDGSTAVRVGAGSVVTVQAKRGVRYRLQNGSDPSGEPFNEEVFALRDNDNNLVVLLQGQTKIVFNDFFLTCDDGACAIELPDVENHLKMLDGGSTAIAAAQDGTQYIYSFSNSHELKSIVEPFAAQYGVANELTDLIANVHVQRPMYLPIIGGLGGLGAAGAAVGGASGGESNAGYVVTDVVIPPTVLPTRSMHVSGNVVAGPVIEGHGLEVRFYDLAGNLIGNAVTIASDGTFEVDLPVGYLSVVMARVTDKSDGADYLDEATGKAVDLQGDLRLYLSVNVEESASVTVSPLSELAVRYAEKRANNGVVGESAASEANYYVAAAFGISGAVHQPVAAVIDKYGDVSGASNYVGKLLASMSGLSANFGYEQSFEYLLLALDKNDLNTPAYVLSFGANAVDKANPNVHLVDSIASGSTIFAEANEVRLAAMDAIKRDLRVHVLSNLGPEDAADMTADTLTHLSAEDMEYIPVEALAHINASQLAAAQLTYLSSEQMQALYGLHVQTRDFGTGFDFTLNRRPELFGTLSVPLPQGASLAIMAYDEQIGTATLSQDRLTWTFRPSQDLYTLLYPLGVAVSTPEMSSLHPGEPLNIDIRTVAMLSASEIGQLPADYLSNVDAGSFDGLTVEQLKALTVPQLTAMSNEQKLHAFSPSIDSLFSNGHPSTLDRVSADGLELHGSLKAPIPDGASLRVPLFEDGQLAGEVDVTGATWLWRQTGPMENGPHYFTAGSAISAKTLIAMVDSISPHISSIVARVNGAMSVSAQVGNELKFLMSMNEEVTVDTTAGTPTLNIIIGSTVRHLPMAYANSSLLEFTYQVADDDIDRDGITLGEEALSLNGASIRDLVGNDVVLDGQIHFYGSMNIGVANSAYTNQLPFPI